MICNLRAVKEFVICSFLYGINVYKNKIIFFIKMILSSIAENSIIKKNEPDCNLKIKPNTKAKTIENTRLSYSEYSKNKNILEKYKIPELKSISRQHKLHVSGTKTILIKRIENFFIQTNYAIKIQKIFRRFLVNQFIKLKGPASKQRSLCVNETDFYSLEPLNEISVDSFYSYRDSKEFVYGFNIFSIIQYFLKKGSFINPYNREKMNNQIIYTIFSLYYKTLILFDDLYDESLFSYNEKTYIRNYFRNIQFRKRLDEKMKNPPRQSLENTIVLENNGEPNINEIINTTPIQNVVDTNNTINNNRIQLLDKMRDIRMKPINTRIQELFIEIDLLGNYSQSQWFSSLSKGGYIHFFRYLYQYWTYRGRISFSVKQKICILGEPFHNMNMNFTENEISIDDCRGMCVYVMENMVFCGESDEYRKLGAFYILAALTVVSLPARMSMMWLYESLPL